MPNAPTETHFRCRLIFLSSCIVMEPTLKGTLFLDATYDQHTIDASRIVSVREVSDDGPGEIIVAFTDLNAHYDNVLMGLARHAVQGVPMCCRCVAIVLPMYCHCVLNVSLMCS